MTAIYSGMRHCGRVKVLQTEIGRGVFAARRFEPEETIGEVRGRVMDDPEYASTYCIEINANRSLEPFSPFRYLNHCCEPNCELAYWDEIEQKTGERQLWVQALKTIEAGEELLIDYAWAADAAIPCLCRAPTCRGWIVDLNDMARLKERLAEEQEEATVKELLSRHG